MSELRLIRPGVSVEDAEPPLRSVAKLLRVIAEELETGAYGLREAQEQWGADYVCRGALVLRISGQEPQIFGLGDTSTGQTYMDFHAGAAELMGMKHAERG